MDTPLFTLGTRIFRTIIPELQDRTPLTLATAPYPIVCYIPFIVLAYLSRRPNTHLLRLAVLPIAVVGILTAAYRFVWLDLRFNVYNWGQCLLAAVTLGKSFESALHRQGMLKIGEIRPGQYDTKAINGNGNGNGNGHACHKTQQRFPAWLSDTVEVAHTLRGLQFQFGKDIPIPKDTRPLERLPFLRATLISFLLNYLLLDVFESTIKLFPGVGTPYGGSMFYQDKPPHLRYAISTFIHILTGFALMFGFNMVYHLITSIAVGLFDSPTTSWPPVMDNPLAADSMHVFWSRKWHQLLRQTFIVLGGYPGKWIAGDFGMLCGTFIASGLFHECAMHSMGRGFDHTVPIFFVVQVPLLILERQWVKFSGRRMSGWLGRLLVYANLFIGAQPMVDAWHQRGLGGGMVIPPIFSPTRLWLFPYIQSHLGVIA